MIRRILFAVSAMVPSVALPQEPVLMPGPTVPIEMLRAEFLARSGGTMVYFGTNSALIGAPARPMLEAQAQWLRQNPFVSVRIEGHGDPGDTRDHALALGAKRAAAVRDAYVLLGIPPRQVTITSWGGERPGPPRAEIRLVP